MTTVCGCGHEKALHNHQTDFCKVEGCGCCLFISDVAEWKEAKARWDWEDSTKFIAKKNKSEQTTNHRAAQPISAIAAARHSITSTLFYRETIRSSPLPLKHFQTRIL